MPSPDEIGVAARDAATAYGVEEFVTGAASRQGEVDDLAAKVADLADQERANIVTIAGLRSQIAELQLQVSDLSNAPPLGYTVPKSPADIQACVDAGPTFLTNGDWPLSKQLLAGDGFDLLLAPDAWLLRTWNSSTAAGAALIATRDLTTNRQGFSLQGGHIGQRVPTSGQGKTGGVLCIRADDQVIRDIDIPYWVGGRAFCGGGERPDHDNVTGASAPYDYNLGPDQPAGSGCGGWRWMTGGGGTLTRINLTSGDDALQFVPAGPGDPMFNAPDIHDIAYEDCTVRSYKARPTVIGLQAGNDSPEGSITAGMTSGVHRVAFRRIRGRTSSTPVNIANHHSVGGISDVEFEDVVIDQDGLLGTIGQPGEIFALRQPLPDGSCKVGPVERIDLSGVTVNEWTDTRIPPKSYFLVKGPVGSVVPPPPQA